MHSARYFLTEFLVVAARVYLAFALLIAGTATVIILFPIVACIAVGKSIIGGRR